MQPSILDQINQNTSQYGAPALNMNTATPSNGDASSVLSQLSGLNKDQTTSQPTTQPTEKGNWFTHLIPTIASIGGGILGTLADPFTAGLGTFAGGAGGSALGKSIENALEGQNTTAQDLLTSGGEGLLGAGLGKVAGSAIGGIGKVIGGVGEKGLATQAATQAANSAVNDAQAVRAAYAGVKGKVLENNNLAQTIKTAKDLGIDHLDPAALSQTSTNAGDVLNSVINQHLAANGPVNATGYTDMIKNAINQRANILGSTDAVALSKGRMGLPNNPATQVLKQLQLLGDGKSLTAADPTEIRKVVTQLGSMAADAKPSVSGITGAIDPVQKATYDTINDVRGQLKDMLYNRPGVNKSVADQIGNIRAEDVGGNQLLADHLNQTISNAQTPQDLLDEYSKFISMGKIGDAAATAAQNPATVAAVNAAKAALPEAQGGALGNSGTTLGNTIGASGHPISKLVSAALNIGSKGGTAGKAASTLGSTLQRISSVAGLGAGETAANLPNSVMGGASAGTQVGGATPAIGTGNTGTIENQILNSNNPNTLALKQLLGLQQFGGGYNVPTEMGLYAQPAATELTNLTQANTAEQQLQHYVQLLNEAGGAQGGIGGLLATLGSKITGGPAAQLDAEKQQIAESLSKLTGGPVNLPGITMDQNAANSVLSQLEGALSSYKPF